MSVKRVVPIVRVTDIDRAVAFYGLILGFTIDFRYSAGADGPVYVGISRDRQQVHLSTFGGDGALGTAVYFYVEDVDALFAGFVKAGLKTPHNPDSPVEDGPVDQSWGTREFYVRDPDGNTLRFSGEAGTATNGER